MKENDLESLASAQQLTLFAIFCVICVTLIIIGTWTGNQDLWDKAGEEMRKLGTTAKRWLKAVVTWPIGLILTQRSKILGIQEYKPRHLAA